MENYKNASAGPEKRFCLAYLILMNRGMEPYLEPVNHHGGIDEHDYFNGNYWGVIPVAAKDDSHGHSVEDILSTYEKPVLRALLSPTEQMQADKVRKIISATGPAHMLCQTIMDWAHSHPNDPRVPEMLYRLVKLPLWSQHTPYGSRFSHAALALLHLRYPASSWAKRASWAY